MPIKIKFFALLFLATLWSSAVNATSDEKLAQFYKPSDSQPPTLSEAMKLAQTQDKLLLVLVGAGWCHDSLALADYFSSPRVKKTLSKGYIVYKINAQWLTDLTQELSQIHHPAYFGTPSLLIVDPVSQMVVNRDSVQRWQSAHSESMPALNKYLSLMRNQRHWFVVNVPETQRLTVSEFEKQQTMRLYRAYQLLGPMLESEKAGQAQPTLDAVWDEVRSYRYHLQKDLVNLYQYQADAPLILPEYPLMSWEMQAN